MPQEKIQAWIERIPIYIQQIIALESDNGYEEGRNAANQSREFTRVR